MHDLLAAVIYNRRHGDKLRLQAEAERLWALHVKRNGPPLIRAARINAPASPLPTFSLGALLDDRSPMPDDIIAPRVLTPGGLLVLGGAPGGDAEACLAALVQGRSPRQRMLAVSLVRSLFAEMDRLDAEPPEC